MTIRAREWWEAAPLPVDREEQRRRAAAEEGARRKAQRAAMSNAPADPREALGKAVAGGRDSLAALSRMLGRGDGYLHRFIHHGVPMALTADDHRRLADYFGLIERELGIRDLWVGRH